MGKKNRHSKDQLFITATEWSTEYGGKKKARGNHDYRPLPFDHCALSLSPFEQPACTKEGVVFDLVNILEYIKKHKSNPITGEPITSNDIIRLKMFKNAEDKWHCPVTCKVFNNTSHIVAIKTTGNVFSYDAVHELNIKPKIFNDLLTNEPFAKSDIITIQNHLDEEHMKKRDVNTFMHLQQVRKDLLTESQSSTDHHMRSTPMIDKVMNEVKRRRVENEEIEKEKKSREESIETDDDSRDIRHFLNLNPTTEDVNPGQRSTSGQAACSLTSTTMTNVTTSETRLATAEEIREAKYRKMKKLKQKGFVQLQTNLGNLNLEIHCDIAPRTATNFLSLCERGYYDNVTFHRLIPKFMVQGGDPTGTGTGGASVWGRPFKDEFDSRLWHTERGIVSMANSGPDSNKSQFFITFKDCRHLDNKHTVFGRVVGGHNVLNRIEEVGSTGADNIPKEPIVIMKTVVFTNPIPEADEMLLNEIKENINRRLEHETPSALPKARIADVDSNEPSKTNIKEKKAKLKENSQPTKVFSTSAVDDVRKSAPPVQSKKTFSNFNNFSNW